MKTPSDVLFVSGTLEVGGSESKIVRIANALARDGYSAGIAYLNPPETLRGKIDPAVPVTDLGRRGKYSLQSLRRLRRMLAGQLIVSVNFYPLLYVVPAVRLAGTSGARAACLINTTEFVDSQWIWGHIYAPFLARCDLLVYGCRAQQALWERKYRLPPEKSLCVYNGVDVDHFSTEGLGEAGRAFRAQFGIPENAVVIGSVGRLAPEKNFRFLVEAAGKLRASGRDAFLVLVGEGREKELLTSAAGKHGLRDRLIMPGVLDDIRPAISAMDIFVLPSRAVETFSNAALEAMALKRPVILSNIGGAAEMLEHGRSGYLFEAGDLQQASKLLRDLYDSKTLRESVGLEARRRIIERFRFQDMLGHYKALIEAR